uniref:BTB domain-containing protein n=1 Tax=Timema tahoe TaxID=61484 RepID=A0A7R9NUI4_9NEOP|nr:unnamed protein product [Timema tahoe]
MLTILKWFAGAMFLDAWAFPGNINSYIEVVHIPTGVATYTPCKLMSYHAYVCALTISVTAHILRTMGTPCDWQILKQKVSERGEHLLDTSQWSDCKFIVGTEPHQKIFGGHKLFLAMSSPVFEAMFYGGMAEKNDPISILDVQPDAFKALLEYIYTDSINLQSFDQACELCYVAKKYMLPHLVKECTDYLWRDLFPKNACRAYEFAKLFEEPSLMEKCLQLANALVVLNSTAEDGEIEIICSKTEAVLSDPSFEEAELSTVITILDQEALSISSELVLFEALQRWANKECARKGLPLNDDKSLRSVCGSALEKIRFLTLNPSQFAEGPALSPLLTQSESFAVLMNISSGGARVPLPEGFSTWTQPRQEPDRFSNHPVPPLAPEPYRQGQKYYCMRKVSQKPAILNTSILDCSVTFTVDRNVCVFGVQVPTQVPSQPLPENPELNSYPMTQAPQGTNSYTELLYAHLLDSDGSRLTYTHFTSRVAYSELIEISFNRPVFIQRNKVYRVGVVLNKMGWYPMASCSQSVNCEPVFFSFCVGQPNESVRDGLIRSIGFSY